MNGIRLAVISLSAVFFLSADISEVFAQRGPARGYQEQAKRAMEEAMRGSLGEDPGRGPGDEPASKSSNSSRSSRGTSNSRSSSKSSRNRSRSRSNNNAIKTNPLFALFDENGDGELSLEEIDAASRLLYSLDANEDDTITADEVEDMAMEGAVDDEDDDDEEFEDQARSRSSRSSRSSRPSRSGGGKFAGGAGGIGIPGAGDNAQSGRGSRGSSRSGGSLGGGGKFAGGAGGIGIPGAGDEGGRRGSSSNRSNDSNESENFSDLDEDEDGVLKRGELPSKLRTKFRRMDANRDGQVDQEEYEEFLNGK